jgi:hypothetical protein
MFHILNNTKIFGCRKVLKVVRLGEMDADQTVDSVHEAELLSNLHNEHIVKVRNVKLFYLKTLK